MLLPKSRSRSFLPLKSKKKPPFFFLIPTFGSSCANAPSTCGVTAIGRCATCDYAFCLTHQGRIYDNFHGWITYVDMCASCLAVKQAEEAKRKKEARVPYNYFMSGAARTDLLTTGVPTIEIYQIGKNGKLNGDSWDDDTNRLILLSLLGVAGFSVSLSGITIETSREVGLDPERRR